MLWMDLLVISESLIKSRVMPLIKKSFKHGWPRKIYTRQPFPMCGRQRSTFSAARS